MMANIRSQDTRPEMIVRRYLHARGLRYRLGGAGLPGRPDLVFRSKATAVFVHGCFWHRHEGCHFTTHPKTRVEFWQQKFAENKRRDRRVARQLAEMGWQVEIVWGCEVKDEEKLFELFNRLSCR